MTLNQPVWVYVLALAASGAYQYLDNVDAACRNISIEERVIRRVKLELEEELENERR